MTRRRTLLAALGACAIGRPAAAAFPERAITLVVPFAPGGIADLTARAVAEAMARSLGRAVVVDNRPGAGGIVAGQAVARASADGHTLLLMSNANAVSPSLIRRMPFDAQRDFAPIGTLGLFPLVVLCAADARWRTLTEFVADARSRPGRLTIGTIATGSTQHLAAHLFKSRAGVDALVVPFKGSPDVLRALRANEIDLAFEILGPAIGPIAGGTVRALAVTGSERDPATPAVPTAAEAGLADYVVESWNALAAPAGTPPAVIGRLHGALRDALADPQVRARLAALGVRAAPGTPQELAELLARETRRWREVIAAARIATD